MKTYKYQINQQEREMLVALSKKYGRSKRSILHTIIRNTYYHDQIFNKDKGKHKPP